MQHSTLNDGLKFMRKTPSQEWTLTTHLPKTTYRLPF